MTSEGERREAADAGCTSDAWCDSDYYGILRTVGKRLGN